MYIHNHDYIYYIAQMSINDFFSNTYLLFDQSGRFSVLSKTGNTPEEVAASAVYGMRANKRYVFLDKIQEVFVRMIKYV